MRRGKPPPLVCVEPAQIKIEGVFTARALSRVEPGTQEPSSVTSPGNYTVTRASNSCVLLMVANFSDESLTIPKDCSWRSRANRRATSKQNKC